MSRCVCRKCGEIFHTGCYWNPDLGQPICHSCLGLEDEAEEASFMERWSLDDDAMDIDEDA